MPAEIWIARSFGIAGAALLVLGLILWAALPMRLALPPYLFTAVLALGYGWFCRSRARRSGIEKDGPRE